MNLNKYIDHTLLKPTATVTDIKRICNEALKYQFYAVCINNCHTVLVKDILSNSNVKTVCVIGFPLGANTTNSKVFEAIDSIKLGASEIDMVLNIGMLKSGGYKLVENEISLIKKAIGSNILKVILENCYLTNEEKFTASKIALNTGADFIKTSTGFGTSGATFSDIKLMKNATNGLIKIKASGGIRNLEVLKQYLDLGVDRIGTSSGVSIMNSINKNRL